MSSVENDFLRFVMMLYEIIPPVCKDYLKHNVLARAEYGGDLKTFLNKHMHDIYHLVYNVTCCQCGNPSAANINNNRLFGKQFEKLYGEKNVRTQGHVKWGPGRKIMQHCICGYTVVEVCSVDEMDISTINALIQTCVKGLDPSHSMWLSQIIKKRNKLCHIEDVCVLTKDKLNAMWGCIEGSVLGLAHCIPPETSYKKGIEREIKLLKRCHFQREEVTPVLNTIKEECVLMKETISQIFTTLNEVMGQFPQMEQCITQECKGVKEEIKLQKQELIGTAKEISDKVGAQSAIIEDETNRIIETITQENQITKKKLNSIYESMKKGVLQHQNHEVKFEVKWSEQEAVCVDLEDHVVVTWTIVKTSCSEEEKAEIIQNIRKMIQTAALWSPYKIVCTGIGSVVIATLLNKDVFKDKEKFKLSIRHFLDRFLIVSRINCQSPCTIKVNILVSKDVPKEMLNVKETDLLLAKYFDKEQHVVPEMMDDYGGTFIDLPCVFSVNFKKKYRTWFKKKTTLLIANKSDIGILQQIIQLVESFLSANVSEIDSRILITSKPKAIGAVYVVMASSHTRRTVINTILNFIHCPKRVDLVPSDLIRNGYSSSAFIVIDEGQNWKEKIISNIIEDQSLKKYSYVPPGMNIDGDRTFEERLASHADCSLEEKMPSYINQDQKLTGKLMFPFDTPDTVGIKPFLTTQKSLYEFEKERSLPIQLGDKVQINKQEPATCKDDEFDEDTDEMSIMLWKACQNGNSKKVNALLEPKANVNVSSKTGLSPLLIASQEGCLEIVKILLKNNADINRYTFESKTPLYIACEKRRTEIVKLLLEHKANVYLCSKDGCSPLYIACWNGFEEIVNMLLENKADVNKCTDVGSSPLYTACANGKTEIVKMLLQYKANVNKCRNDGSSPLHEACGNGETVIVKMLLANKADVNICTEYGYSPLYEACGNGETDIVKMLLENKADVNICTEYGYSPLYEACERGQTAIVKMLLENKAVVNKSTEYGSFPLYKACVNGNTEIVKMLLVYKADVNRCTNGGYTPLYEACKSGETVIVKMLLEYKADVNVCPQLGSFPLYEACKNNYTEIVKLLLEYKADVNKFKVGENSPLHLACIYGNSEIVKMLLEYKADVNKCIVRGYSPLHEACKKNKTDIVKMLLENKASVNMCTVEGYSPLYFACKKGEMEIVKMLLEYKADVNKCTCFGSSPLYEACKNGAMEIVKLLLEYKADIYKCNEQSGKTPLTIAYDHGYMDIVTLIKNNM